MTEGIAIQAEDLSHDFNGRVIYDNLSFSVREGGIFGLLGKNGVGKTTLIKLLMGFLRPSAGVCRVLGEESHNLSPIAKTRIGLVFEGHLAYEFMSIGEAEKFFSAWFPKWRREVFFDLVDRLGLPYTHRIRNMSEGQRSQVVLGLVMAQDPDLLILDDYTMGLDAGYRRLFLDYLVRYAREGNKTVLVTSHVVQDMERLVDDVIFLRRGGDVLQTSLTAFMGDFRQYRLPPDDRRILPKVNGVVHNLEPETDGSLSLFAFHDRQRIEAELGNQGVATHGLTEIPMSLEDAFIGYTGKY
ncbi:MAG: ABC transporter ATP-binding protein [Rhodospirillales bacterium]|nr:ABC transporter ATP-binding protein [Rhodospirillales bacterium]